MLSTSPQATVQSASPFFRETGGRTAEVGPVDQPVTARLIGGSFTFDRRARELLLDSLPPLIHLPAHAEGADMVPHLLSRIERETARGGIGADLVTEHLAVVLLIDLIRCHLAHQREGTGWLHGLSEPVVSAALHAIHADPAHRWTVALLADAAHVSRSTLATRFKRTVGRGPLEYLTRWRLELGAHRLAATSQTIAAIAGAVGYGSEAAFSLAFKRELGTSPGRYRKQARTHEARTGR
ncbi:AraC family transcriptional regulator [Actinocorallia aurea]